MKCINCILFLHVIDTIVSFRHSQLNWMRKFHSRSIAPPIDEVHQLHPIHPCNWYHCFLSFPIEFIEIISFQFNCFSNWWGSTWIASYSSMYLIPPLAPFIPNLIERDNIIPDQLLSFQMSPWIASYCFLWFSIELNEILSFQINCYTIIPFILNCIQWDNFIPDQLLLQLMKYINCILFLHVIDTILSFHSQLNSLR